MMAKQGLGFVEDELSPLGLVTFTTPSSADDVHNASTTVAELPPHILEALKPPGLRIEREEAVTPPPPSAGEGAGWAGAEGVLDLVERLDEGEPKTVQLDTIVLDIEDIESIPELPVPPDDEAPPQTIELHVIREGGPLAAVETELARLPRAWLVAGALVASVSIAGVMVLFCWMLLEIVF